jgi:putative glutamine amidotransferase
MKPIILLTTGYYTAKNGLYQRRLYQNYADAVSAAGGIALLAFDDGEDAALLAERCDGLVLTGGADIHPDRYQEEIHPACGEIDLRRDRAEFALLEAFCRRKKPVLGICRGIQVINVLFGGTLWQDLQAQCGASGHERGEHRVDFTPGSILSGLFGPGCGANSYHHQAVKTPGEGLRVTAYADSVVEGLEHVSLPILAVQWHAERMTGPERFVQHGPDTAALFSHLTRACGGK